MKFAALGIAAAGLNEAVTNAVPAMQTAGDAVSPLLAAWEKTGMIGVLLVIITALWIDSKREQKAAAEYRERREKTEAEKAEREEKRHLDQVTALNNLSATLRENAVRCEAMRQAMERQKGKP